jgi:hypothetical protein
LLLMLLWKFDFYKNLIVYVTPLSQSTNALIYCICSRYIMQFETREMKDSGFVCWSLYHQVHIFLYVKCNFLWIWIWILVFNATFSNISAISWWPVLVVFIKIKWKI